MRSIGENTVGYLDTGLTEATTYQYKIKAVGTTEDSNYAFSNQATTPEVTTTDPPPETPTEVVATASSATEINIAWTDQSDNEVGFRLKRTQDSGATWQSIAELGENTVGYLDTGLTEATTYQYKIKAVGTTEDSNYAFSNQATTPEVTTTDPPPETPTEVVATASSATEINIAWTDQSDNEVGFRLKRTQDSGATWQSIAELGENTVGYSDTGLTEATTYQYKIKAVGTTEDSDYAFSNQATTPTEPENQAPQVEAGPNQNRSLTRTSRIGRVGTR